MEIFSVNGFKLYMIGLNVVLFFNGELIAHVVNDNGSLSIKGRWNKEYDVQIAPVKLEGLHSYFDLFYLYKVALINNCEFAYWATHNGQKSWTIDEVEYTVSGVGGKLNNTQPCVCLRPINSPDSEPLHLDFSELIKKSLGYQNKEERIYDAKNSLPDNARSILVYDKGRGYFVASFNGKEYIADHKDEYTIPDPLYWLELPSLS